MIVAVCTQEENPEDTAAAEAATDAANLSPEALAPGDGSATDRDLEDLVGPACLLRRRGINCLF